MPLIQNLVVGLEMGSYIAVAAIGFTLVYGLLDVINFAHGELVMLGAYVGIVTVNYLHLSVVVGLIVAVVLTAVSGWAIARAFYTPLRDAGAMAVLVTSIGISFILRYGAQIVAGPSPIYLQSSLTTSTVGLGEFTVSSYTYIVIGIALLTFLGLHLVLRRTWIGIALRAMSADEDLAVVTGINTERLRTTTWLVSAGLAGLAGYLLLFPQYAAPHVGFDRIILIIAAVILGGAGSVYGAIAGAYLIGITVALATGEILPPWGTGLGTTMAFIVLFAVLLVKPGGITGGDLSARRGGV